MSEMRITPDLFIGAQELSKFQKLINEKFDIMMMYQTREYGILKDYLNRGEASQNFLLTENVSTADDGKMKLAQKSYALDAANRLITKDIQSDIDIPDDNNWYWVKIVYAYTSQEVGTVSISTDGSLLGVGTKFTEVLRGLPDFPVSIKFINSINGNTQEYKVLSVIDDTNAVVSGTFVSEQDLYYKVAGTFTPGVQKSDSDKFIYRYDSCIDFTVSSGAFVLENPQGTDTRPATISGYEFFIARVRNNGGTVDVQDKRINFYRNRFE